MARNHKPDYRTRNQAHSKLAAGVVIVHWDVQRKNEKFIPNLIDEILSTWFRLQIIIG